MCICRHCSPLLCFILFPKIKCIVPREWNLKWQLSAWLTPSQRAEPKEVMRVNLSLFHPVLTLRFKLQNSCIHRVCHAEPKVPIAHTCTSDARTLWVPVSLGSTQFCSLQIVPFARSDSTLSGQMWADSRLTESGPTTTQMKFDFNYIIVCCPLTCGASQN